MGNRFLDTLTVKGFLTIRDQTLRLDGLNVLIGGNGSGKSNLIQVFNLLQHVVDENLRRYVGVKGGAHRLLHYGTQTTQAIEVGLDVRQDQLANRYWCRLIPTDDDSLIFDQETVFFHDQNSCKSPIKKSLGTGHSETLLGVADSDFSRYLRSDLNKIHIYQFNDTSPTSLIRKSCHIADNRSLRQNGSNLSAFLYLLKQNHAPDFQRIERAVRRIAPFFGSFSLEPSKLNPELIQLEWTDTHHHTHFGAASLPDGLLRFICLATVFHQPSLPPIIVLDEPELGLHPAAIVYIVELMKKRSADCQILAATQSVTMLNQLEPENVWVTERHDEESVYKRLAEEDLEDWLDSYSIGEIWEKNIIGGRP